MHTLSTCLCKMWECFIEAVGEFLAGMEHTCMYTHIHTYYEQVPLKDLGGFDVAVDEYFAGMERYRELREDQQEFTAAKKKVCINVCIYECMCACMCGTL